VSGIAGQTRTTGKRNTAAFKNTVSDTCKNIKYVKLLEPDKILFWWPHLFM